MEIERLPPRSSAIVQSVFSTVAILAILELIAMLADGLPPTSPILALTVGITGGALGIAGGLTSALITGLFVLVEGFGPGLLFPHDATLPGRFVIALVTLPSLGFFVGWLRMRAGERIRSERAARVAIEAGERRYRELVEGLDAVVWEATPPDYTVDYVSRKAVDLFGYPLADWLASDAIWQRLIHPDDYAREMSARHNAVRTREGYRTEHRVITLGGLVLWTRSFVDVVVGSDDSVHLRCVMVDVTDRRRAEMLARENEERVRSLLDHAADGVLVHDVDGRFVDVNQAACDALGYSRAELLRLRIADVEVDFEQGEDGRSMWRRLAPGERVQHDAVYRRKDGSTYPVEVRIGIFEWSGRPLVVVLARDVSERKRLEQQLRQSQKMDAIGRLAGGVAHDFNNLLTAIKGHADLLLADASPGSKPDLEEITRAADRAAALTRKLLAFSRQQIFAPEVIDLNSVVLDTGRLLRPLIGEHIQFETKLAGVGRVRADRGQIEQVLINLLVNSRDAMPDGGHLEIATYDLDVTPDRPFRHSFVRPGEYSVLRVRDTGHGMDAEIMSRIFEPFFTTKDKGKGTGLGLATAYGIVKQSSGYLIPESEPGRGATFLVILPRTPDAVTPAVETPVQQPDGVPVRESGDRVVLVVEDEDPVRALVCRVLTRNGYTVLEAASGQDALDRARSYDGHIDLLISDVVMPEIGGHELARTLTAVRPDTQVILMSGYADDIRIRGGDVPGGTTILDKPFTPDQLTRKVREILERAGRP
ncbi:MAG: PAS domain S-box protein [Gemmatimonadetes bacterium]|nr:PAS domain S-box protein [Gemmatimonadota bacterium]